MEIEQHRSALEALTEGREQLIQPADAGDASCDRALVDPLSSVGPGCTASDGEMIYDLVENVGARFDSVDTKGRRARRPVHAHRGITTTYPNPLNLVHRIVQSDKQPSGNP